MLEPSSSQCSVPRLLEWKNGSLTDAFSAIDMWYLLFKGFTLHSKFTLYISHRHDIRLHAKGHHQSFVRL